MSATSFVMLPGIESFALHDHYVHKGDDLHIGDGDPIIVHSDKFGSVCLGTGMTCMDDIVAQTVRKIGPVEGEHFEIFLPAGGFHFDNIQ